MDAIDYQRATDVSSALRANAQSGSALIGDHDATSSRLAFQIDSSTAFTC